MKRWWLLFNLRLSCSSELGAARAYEGHAKFVRRAEHRGFIEQVHRDELHHREELRQMLEARGARTWWLLEALFWCIGTVIGLGCLVWGDWASATGAGWFEINGESEYRRLAQAAESGGDPELVAVFREMELQEASHRRLFFAMARGGSAEDLERSIREPETS